MIKVIDFFCGAGGLTRGLLNAGIKVLAGVNNNEHLQKTYTHNNKPSRFINKDINAIDIHELRKELEIQDEDTTLYAACTPCQPFSTLSRQNWKNDDRKILLLTLKRYDAINLYRVFEPTPVTGVDYNLNELFAYAGVPI